ncbi:MAG TPA: peptide deformylase [Phycisphaerae bacterium]|nr:peptide deformylase [Phycisphaerae bacterium]
MPLDVAALQIINYPDARLRKACGVVERFDEELAALAERMFLLMRQHEGVGLAAPQLGVLLRMFICNPTGDPKDDHVYVNPRLTDFVDQADREEGCLSIPDVTVNVRRPLSCRIHAFDLQGRPIEEAGSDLLARCWQHECDHLEGRLIIDRMSESDKIANRKAIRQLEADHESKIRRGGHKKIAY